MTITKNETQLRPLGKLMNLIETAGFVIEYEYDDLVFVNNTAFLFRFDQEKAESIHLHFNIECDKESKAKISNKLLLLSKQEEVNLVLSNNYEMQNSISTREEFQIIFK